MNSITVLENFFIERFRCDRKKANVYANLLLDRLYEVGLQIIEMG